MYSIDVRTEVRKITSSKPVHAAAGAGALATQTLRELPGRLVRGIDGTVTAWPSRANEYVQNARAKAADQYDKLADPGLSERQKQVLLEIYESFRKEMAASAEDEAEGEFPDEGGPRPDGAEPDDVVSATVWADAASQDVAGRAAAEPGAAGLNGAGPDGAEPGLAE